MAELSGASSVAGDDRSMRIDPVAARFLDVEETIILRYGPPRATLSDIEAPNPHGGAGARDHVKLHEALWSALAASTIIKI